MAIGMLLTEFGQAKMGQGKSVSGLNLGLLHVPTLTRVEEAANGATMGLNTQIE